MNLHTLKSALSSVNLGEIPEDDIYFLVQKGAILSLQETGSPEAVLLLEDTAWKHPDDLIRECSVQALAFLARNGSSPALQSLYSLAVFHQNAVAIHALGTLPACENPALNCAFLLISGQAKKLEEIDPGYTLLTNFYLSASPPIRSQLLSTARGLGLHNWVLICQSVVEEDAGSLEALVESYPLLKSEERLLAMQHMTVLAATHPRLVETICDIVILHEDNQALEAALQYKFFPQDLTLRALFYFLTEQWNLYHRLDFDHSLLLSAYQAASLPVRKRILAISKESGETGWLSQSITRPHSLWVGDMTDHDWEYSITTLQVGKQYEQLFRLAHYSPPFWAAKILGVLLAASWSPDTDSEKQLFSTLISSMRCSTDDPLQPKPTHHLYSAAAQITCMVLDPHSHTLIAGHSCSEILRWEIEKEYRPLPIIQLSIPSTRALVCSPDGAILAAAGGDHSIRLLSLPDGKQIKLIGAHENLITALVFMPDGKTLASSSFDGSLRLWRVPFGTPIRSFNINTEIFSVGVHSNGNPLLAADGLGRMIRLSLPDLEELESITAHQGQILRLALSPVGELAASYGKDDQMVRIWNYLSGKKICEFKSASPVTALHFLSESEVLAVGNQDGILEIYNTSSARRLGKISIGRKSPITSIQFDPELKLLAASSFDGAIFLWNLDVIFIVNRNVQLQVVAFKANVDNLSHNESAWINFILTLNAWRKRYDIEMDFSESVIHAGEYDIELDLGGVQ